MKTINGILAEIHQHKTCSIPQLYRYLNAAGIKPHQIRTRPRLYPDDSANRILKYLGIIDAAKPARLETINQLRKEKQAA